MARILNLILGPHRFATHSPWGVMTGICAIFGVVILSLVFSVIALVVLTAVTQFDMLGCVSQDLSVDSAACARGMVGITGGSAVVLIVAFYLLSIARKGGTAANTLLLRPADLRWWQYGLMSAVMIAGVLASLNLTLVITGSSEADFEVGIDYLKQIVGEAGWLNWFLILAVVVVLGPLMEEIVFRGFMFTTLIRTRLGFVGTAIITSGLWTLMHYHYKWQLMIGLFAFGLALAYVVWRTGSLWPGIVGHAANNLASALLLALR